ncbi:hypothetical protein [Promicromonospora sp. NPDC050249]|uniref:hypothetical protein n=1 Tax=Promicromonospora sp. NPDC050249 TaxID=3154743 RepID=UPI0033F955CD
MSDERAIDRSGEIGTPPGPGDETGLGALVKDPLFLAAIPIAPFVLIAFNVWSITRGDANATLAVIQHVNPLSLVLATWTDLVATVAVLGVVLQRRIRARPGRIDPFAVLVVAGILCLPAASVAIFAFYAWVSWMRRLDFRVSGRVDGFPLDELNVRSRAAGTSLWTGAALAVFAALAFLIGLISAAVSGDLLLLLYQVIGAVTVTLFVLARAHEAPGWIRLADRAYPALLLVLLLLWSLWVPVASSRWLPNERVVVEGLGTPGATSSRYHDGMVVNVDDVSLLLLRDDGALEQIPTRNVVGRAVCPVEMPASEPGGREVSLMSALVAARSEAGTTARWQDPICRAADS